ncbi:MAG: hypothetical protein LBK99_19220 [Opitutaceae bacterium]|jgi:hypothetical protein|nr:hypothetical protein [Opitutaceae bacterium]
MFFIPRNAYDTDDTASPVARATSFNVAYPFPPSPAACLLLLLLSLLLLLLLLLLLFIVFFL